MKKVSKQERDYNRASVGDWLIGYRIKDKRVHTGIKVTAVADGHTRGQVHHKVLLKNISTNIFSHNILKYKC